MTLLKSGSELYFVSTVILLLIEKRVIHSQFSLWQSFGKSKIGSLAIGRRCPLYKPVGGHNLLQIMEKMCIICVTIISWRYSIYN